MGFGMIVGRFRRRADPNRCNGQLLGYAAPAAQKSALYPMTPYQDPAHAQRLRDEFATAGKKLDTGKSCVRFKRLGDLPLEVIGRRIASTPPAALIAPYPKARADTAAARA